MQNELEEKMAYDESLAKRVQDVLVGQPGLEAKKMFGGVGYVLLGNMACGVHGDKLIVRVGKERYEHAIQLPHTVPFDITGRPMKGWVMVVREGYETDADLKEWVQQGVDFALTLPPK
jgi:hypothetical protein